MEKKAGEELGQSPAFPSGDSGNQWQPKGMTLRQYYVGLAMQGVLASYAHPESDGTTGEHENVAKDAVIQADALLAALALSEGKS